MYPVLEVYLFISNTSSIFTYCLCTFFKLEFETWSVPCSVFTLLFLFQRQRWSLWIYKYFLPKTSSQHTFSLFFLQSIKCILRLKSRIYQCRLLWSILQSKKITSQRQSRFHEPLCLWTFV